MRARKRQGPRCLPAPAARAAAPVSAAPATPLEAAAAVAAGRPAASQALPRGGSQGRPRGAASSAEAAPGAPREAAVAAAAAVESPRGGGWCSGAMLRPSVRPRARRVDDPRAHAASEVRRRRPSRTTESPKKWKDARRSTR